MEQAAGSKPDPAHRTELASGEKPRPAGDGQHHGDQRAPGRHDGTEPPAGQGAGETRKVYVDGHEIEVTENPADGIWIPGLPGEVPDKTGDVLAAPEDAKRSLGDKFFHAAVEGTDDLYEGVEKNASLSYDALRHPPPAHAEVGVPGGPPTIEAQQQCAPDMGGMATGILTLGILGWAAGRRIHEWIDQRARRTHDASN